MIRRGSWREFATSGWAVAVVLLAFYAVMLASVREKSAAFDEPGHATAGYVYWKYDDYRIDPENGNLSKRWIALPYLFSGYAFPPATSLGWREANTWQLSDEWFNRLGNDVTSMLARGRAMSALVAVALGIAVWAWSRQLFGAGGAMFSLLLYVLNPAILANGPLMTSDVPAALGFLVSLGCIAATLVRITPLRVVATALAVAGLFLAKMSAALLLPMAALLVLARIVDGRPLQLGNVMLARRAQQTAAFAAVAALTTVGVVLLVWASYGFRYSAFSAHAPTPQRFTRPWEWALEQTEPATLIRQLQLTPTQDEQCGKIFGGKLASSEWSYDTLVRLEVVRREVLSPAQNASLDALLRAAPPRFVPRLIHFAREHRLLPESFLYGYANVWKTSDQLVAFLNGEMRETGWRTFFPFTFAVKTPLAFLAILVIAAGLAVSLARHRRTSSGWTTRHVLWALAYPALPLLVLLAVYWAAAIASHLNIGHRHLLPVYPPLFVLCGGVVTALAPATSLAAFRAQNRVRLGVVAGVLVLLLAVETAWRFPNFLAYFNGLVLPSRAYRHLIDSSLDWGQELPAIANYIRAHPKEPAFLAYFGVGRPANYGITARHIGGYLAIEWKSLPPVITRAGPSEDLVAFLREHPQFDPTLVFKVDAERGEFALVHRSAMHRLEAGLYLISASMLQPLYCGRVDGFWNTPHEDYYQQLKGALAPFFGEDREAKIRAMPTRPLAEWTSLFEDYYDFRLARLCTFLRRREPDDLINFSVLVYRLTDADLARALDGPPP